MLLFTIHALMGAANVTRVLQCHSEDIQITLGATRLLFNSQKERAERTGLRLVAT